jgi:hypothetical protein
MPSIIHAGDFTEYDAATRAQGQWAPATLKRLAPFLEGCRVIVQTSDSGHCVTGEVTGIQESTTSSAYPHLAVRGGNGDTTLHRVSDLGPIVVLDDGASPKWEALYAMGEETRAALAAVRAFIGTDFPAGAPYKGPRRWTTTLTWAGVSVAWGESYRDRRWAVDTDGTVTVSH